MAFLGMKRGGAGGKSVKQSKQNKTFFTPPDKKDVSAAVSEA
jgi:hypothetical protein